MEEKRGGGREERNVYAEKLLASHGLVWIEAWYVGGEMSLAYMQVPAVTGGNPEIGSAVPGLVCLCFSWSLILFHSLFVFVSGVFYDLGSKETGDLFLSSAVG